MDAGLGIAADRWASAAVEEAAPQSAVWKGRLWRSYRRLRPGSGTDKMSRAPAASILLVTYNRLAMLRECISSVLANTGVVDYELLVWDNASTDGTGEYLDIIASSHPQVRVVHHSENIGLNGVAACVRLARGHYLVEMDDDVVEVPSGWLAGMIRAFDAVPRAGYLAANVVQDETTTGAKPAQDRYLVLDYGRGVVIEHGPTGGWCTMTSKAVVKRIGNFVEMPGRIFFSEDGDFSQRCVAHRYRIGIVRHVRVYHAAGVKKNLEYGCGEVCRLKYSDGPEYERHLRATLAALDEMGKVTEDAGTDSRTAP